MTQDTVLNDTSNGALLAMQARDVSTEADAVYAEALELATAVELKGKEIAAMNVTLRDLAASDLRTKRSIQMKFSDENSEFYVKTIAAQDRAVAAEVAANSQMLENADDIRRITEMRDMSESEADGMRYKHRALIARLAQLGHKQELSAARLIHAAALKNASIPVPLIPMPVMPMSGAEEEIVVGQKHVHIHL